MKLISETQQMDFIYDSYEERAAHIASMLLQGFINSGQQKIKITDGRLSRVKGLPAWEDSNVEYLWYGSFTRTVNPSSQAEPTSVF